MDWSRVKRKPAPSQAAPGVYADLDDLIRIQFSSRDFSLQLEDPLFATQTRPNHPLPALVGAGRSSPAAPDPAQTRISVYCESVHSHRRALP